MFVNLNKQQSYDKIDVFKTASTNAGEELFILI